MMTSAERLVAIDEHVTLHTGRCVHIRPLRRCEVAPVRELYARLSSRTRYQRFFAVMPELPDAVQRLLACGDASRMSLIAEDEDTQGDVVALGGFAAVDDGTVEVGLVVRDDWQRQGVGIVLADKVLQAAEARGFHRFVANMQADNIAIRRLLGMVGHVLAAKTTTGGVVEVVFERNLF